MDLRQDLGSVQDNCLLSHSYDPTAIQMKGKLL